MKRLGVLFVALVGCNGGESRLDQVLALTGDEGDGATVFADNCAVCHGADGSGDSGPNIQGEDELEEVIGVVLSGEEEMPSFDGDLSDQEIADVAAYVTAGFP